MRAFDRHCNELYPENDKLTQEMVDSFFVKRPTETINSCRQRCYLVSEFIKYLQEREQTNVIVPERPRKRRNTYIPHAFSHEELSDFFEACDNLRYLPNRIDMKIRSMTAPVIFRLLYSTGMRTIEALSLRCEHVDLTEGVISIVGTKDTMSTILYCMIPCWNLCSNSIRKWIVFFQTENTFSCQEIMSALTAAG